METETKTDLTENITISAQSSICITGERTVYFDPYMMPEECHDADFIFITHAHSDHFSPEDIRKVMKTESIFVSPKSMFSDVMMPGIEEKTSFLLSRAKATRCAEFVLKLSRPTIRSSRFTPRGRAGSDMS